MLNVSGVICALISKLQLCAMLVSSQSEIKLYSCTGIGTLTLVTVAPLPSRAFFLLWPLMKRKLRLSLTALFASHLKAKQTVCSSGGIKRKKGTFNCLLKNVDQRSSNNISSCLGLNFEGKHYGLRNKLQQFVSVPEVARIVVLFYF